MQKFELKMQAMKMLLEDKDVKACMETENTSQNFVEKTIWSLVEHCFRRYTN